MRSPFLGIQGENVFSIINNRENQYISFPSLSFAARFHLLPISTMNHTVSKTMSVRRQNPTGAGQNPAAKISMPFG
jgi:hypothetical protein